MRIKARLSVKYILENISQIDIFVKYLILDHSIINRCISNKSLIITPHRIRCNDEKASFGFKYDKYGKLRAKDFGGIFWGDCFDLVGKLTGNDPNVGSKFYKILEIIANDFNIDNNNIKYNIVEHDLDKFAKSKKNVIIDFEIREWNRNDRNYWNKYYLNQKELSYFNVYPVSKYWIDKEFNDNPRYYYKHTDPCYAYWFGRVNGISQVKLYFPLRFRSIYPKFICNTNIIQGIDLPCFSNIKIEAPASESIVIDNETYERLAKYKAFLITKSYKDVMVLAKLLSLVPTAKDITGGYSLYDYDNRGIATALELRRLYGIVPIFITDKLWNRAGTYKNAKDISDYLFHNKKDDTIVLIKDTIKQYTYDETQVDPFKLRCL